ncbi:protein translocase subunit SecD [Streptomyces sp. NPDC047928]|uniref:protein translocase subunit SecD n=1 Tax=unclassified Streptomyces TaxID=2593676 RepID=UPI003713EBE2
MAAPKKGRRPSGPGRPGRALALILSVMVALGGAMFLFKATTPRLGIDLAGGTTITLEAKAQPGQEEAVNPTNLNTAVGIIDRRVNGLGVSEAEVQTQGDRNIVVTIPKGTNEKQAREQVGTTAQLHFRPVLTWAPSGPTAPTPSDSPTSSTEPSASPSTSASAGAGTSATPSASATTQGRAASDVLKKAPTPSTTPGASTSPDASGSPTPTAPTPPGDAADAQLEQQFAALDCTPKAAKSGDKKAVPNPASNVPAEKPTVACGTEGDAKYILGPAEVAGTDVDKANATIDQQRGQWIVQMEFTSAGSKKFQKITSKLSQQSPPMNQFAITLDGQVVSAPSVQQTLSANAEISGSFTQESAQDLANILSYGALPLSFEEANVLTISPTLGGEQLKAGLIAGAIGLALVMLYLIMYYRALAAVAIASLLAMGAMTYAIMSLLGPAIGLALSLPAVCGAIVAIGITADSFIVYFERIRDEVREGRSVRPAIERAWPRARHTILVSDVVSFLAAVVLFFAAVGSVQGFAFVLGLTTLLDVVVVFLLTKPLTSLLARRKFFSSGHPWSGLDPKRLAGRPPIRGGRRSALKSADPKEA